MKLIALRFLIVISTICIPIAFISFITEMIIRFFRNFSVNY